MSLIDNFRRNRPGQGRKPLPTFEAPRVEAKLAEARTAVEAAEAKHAGLSFDCARGLIDRSVAVQAAKELADARQNVEMLEAALKVAEEHDKEAQIARRLHMQKNNLQQVRKHLDARDEAARTLAASLAEVVRAYRALQDHSRRATECLPLGLTEFPAHMLFTRAHIARQVSHEFFRQSFADAPGNELPGSKAPDIMRAQNPRAVKSLAEEIAETNAGVMRELERLVPDAVPTKWLRDRDEEAAE